MRVSLIVADVRVKNLVANAPDGRRLPLLATGVLRCVGCGLRAHAGCRGQDVLVDVRSTKSEGPVMA